MELTISNLTKEFGSFRAVDDVSCHLNCGVYGLLGVNGAGKTTLMRMLTTLVSPTSGEIRLDGQDIFALDRDYRRQLGYLPQDFGFYPDFTVKEYLMYIASIKGIRPAAAQRRTRALLEQVGLEKAGNKKMKTLSGGMRRRAGIAQAMLNNPGILILDELTAALDPSTADRIMELTDRVVHEKKLTALMVTHNLRYAGEYGTRVVMMDKGQIVLDKSGAEKAATTVNDLLGIFNRISIECGN